MSGYGIRYRPGTTLAARFGNGIGGSYDTREAAEAMLRCCTNAADMEVVGSLTQQGSPASPDGKIEETERAPDRVLGGPQSRALDGYEGAAQ